MGGRIFNRGCARRTACYQTSAYHPPSHQVAPPGYQGLCLPATPAPAPVIEGTGHLQSTEEQSRALAHMPQHHGFEVTLQVLNERLGRGEQRRFKLDYQLQPDTAVTSDGAPRRAIAVPILKEFNTSTGTWVSSDFKIKFYADGALYNERGERLGKFGINQDARAKLAESNVIDTYGTLEQSRAGRRHMETYGNYTKTFAGEKTIIVNAPPPNAVRVYRRFSEQVLEDRKDGRGLFMRAAKTNGYTIDWVSPAEAEKLNERLPRYSVEQLEAFATRGVRDGAVEQLEGNRWRIKESGLVFGRSSDGFYIERETYLPTNMYGSKGLLYGSGRVDREYVAPTMPPVSPQGPGGEVPLPSAPTAPGGGVLPDSDKKNAAGPPLPPALPDAAPPKDEANPASGAKQPQVQEEEVAPKPKEVRAEESEGAGTEGGEQPVEERKVEKDADAGEYGGTEKQDPEDEVLERPREPEQPVAPPPPLIANRLESESMRALQLYQLESRRASLRVVSGQVEGMPITLDGAEDLVAETLGFDSATLTAPEPLALQVDKEVEQFLGDFQTAHPNLASKAIDDAVKEINKERLKLDGQPPTPANEVLNEIDLVLDNQTAAFKGAHFADLPAQITQAHFQWLQQQGYFPEVQYPDFIKRLKLVNDINTGLREDPQAPKPAGGAAL